MIGLPQTLLILGMVLLNAVFAAYELALASVDPRRLRVLHEQKRPGSSAAVAMKSRMEGSLAVVQVGITLAGAIAAAIGGANADEVLSPYLRDNFGFSESVASVISLALIVVPLSALTIVVGELVPKVFALQHNEFVCLALSPLMQVFAWVVYPAVIFFETLTKWLVAIVGKAAPKSFRRDDIQTGLNELRSQVSMLRASKVIGVQEEKIIVQASRLSTLLVRDIMMPSDDVVMLEADAPLTRNIVAAHLDLHTRFPVAERSGDVQSIIGYVTYKEMTLLAKTHPENPSLREITRSLTSLPLNLTVSEALRRMIADHVHLALVRDEHGKVVGMITQEDIFEELVGDIEDEFDRLPRHIAGAGRQWIVGGGATLARIRDALGHQEFAAGKPGEMTLNTLLESMIERSPKGGDVFSIDGIPIVVRKVRRHKVSEALVDPEPRRLAGVGISQSKGEATIPTSGV